jgi:2-C-methyl-D-erythritol 4-phosphate cytidylyltransferase
MNSITALLMAAGAGERFAGASTPKQFCGLGGRPVIAWSAGVFDAHEAIGAIVAVVPRGYERQAGEMLEGAGVRKLRAVIAGGATRQESVFAGLGAARGFGDHVLVHDAVRPCVTKELVDRVTAALAAHEAVIPVVPVVDSLYRESNGRMDAILDRAHITHVQTPQGFRTELLHHAHAEAAAKGFHSSDDGSLVFFLGQTVHTVAGERSNIKITYADDITLASAILAGRR